MGSRVLVKTVTPRTKMDEVEEKGMLYIPKSVKEQNTPMPTTGIILQLGAYANMNDDITLQVGDMVMFPKFSGCDFNIEEEDLRILEASEILCTLVDTQGALAEVAKND